MPDLHIGLWVRREGRRTTKGHLIESVIDNDPVTRCGRRMRHRTKPPLVVHAGMVSRAGRPLDWDLCGGGC